VLQCSAEAALESYVQHAPTPGAWSVSRLTLEERAVVYFGPNHSAHFVRTHVIALSCSVFADCGCGRFHPINTPTAIMANVHMELASYLLHHVARKFEQCDFHHCS